MNPEKIKLVQGVLKETGLIKEVKDNMTAHELNQLLQNLNPQLNRETGVGMSDLTPQSNEWLNTLVNKVLRIITVDQLKSIPTFEKYNRGANINGITEFLAVDVIDSLAYTRETTIEQFNVPDAKVDKEYMLDQYKEYFPISYSGEIIARAFTSGGNFSSFLQKYVAVIIKSSALKLYERVVAIQNNYPFRKSVYVKKQATLAETNKLIIKALETEAKRIAIPSREQNENGMVSSATTTGIDVMANIEYSGEISVDVLATLYNSDKLATFKMSHTDIEFTDSTVYANVYDTDKFHYGYSVNATTLDSIGINLKSINALHVWYGFIMLKAMAGFQIKVVETIPADDPATETITTSQVNPDIAIGLKVLDGAVYKEAVEKYVSAMNALQPKSAKELVQNVDEDIKEVERKVLNKGYSQDDIDKLVEEKLATVLAGQDKSIDEIVAEKVAAALAGQPETDTETKE